MKYRVTFRRIDNVHGQPSEYVASRVVESDSPEEARDIMQRGLPASCMVDDPVPAEPGAKAEISRDGQAP